MYSLKCLLRAHISTYLHDIQLKKVKKNNYGKNRVYGTQKKCIQLTDSTHKNKIELVNPVPRNKPETVKFWQNKPNRQIFICFYLKPALQA